MNTLNFNGGSAVINSSALMVRQLSEMSADNLTFKAEVAVDDFTDIGISETGHMWGTVMFYGIK